MEPEDNYILTIDQGNSSAKIVVWQNGSPVDALRSPQLSIEDLLPLMERYDIGGASFCSVAHKDAKFLETLRRLVDGRLVVLTPSLPLPIGLHYESRQSLGSDRVAAAVGAKGLSRGKAALVVDAGTAMTLDFTDAEGNFKGGNISPGMFLRFESLLNATSRLPLVEPSHDLPEFGGDTTTAIRCGVMRGMTAEILDAFSTARRLFDAEVVVMTGADAEFLSPLVEKRGIRVMVDKNLVGRGLEKIFEYNINRRLEQPHNE